MRDASNVRSTVLSISCPITYSILALALGDRLDARQKAGPVMYVMIRRAMRRIADDGSDGKAIRLLSKALIP